MIKIAQDLSLPLVEKDEGGRYAALPPIQSQATFDVSLSKWDNKLSKAARQIFHYFKYRAYLKRKYSGQPVENQIPIPSLPNKSV